MALHADRRAQMRGVVEALTDTELEQIRTAALRQRDVPTRVYGDQWSRYWMRRLAESRGV